MSVLTAWVTPAPKDRRHFAQVPAKQSEMGHVTMTAAVDYDGYDNFSKFRIE